MWRQRSFRNRSASIAFRLANSPFKGSHRGILILGLNLRQLRLVSDGIVLKDSSMVGPFEK